MSIQQTPSEHYLQAARVIVNQLSPDLSLAEQHQKVMYVWRTIMEAVLDAPTKN
jgi:hypothetical protein